ncbi:MAG: hypothetical protein ABIE07_12640 [Candidatus Zixiibacteriota bacterium]
MRRAPNLLILLAISILYTPVFGSDSLFNSFREKLLPGFNEVHLTDKSNGKIDFVKSHQKSKEGIYIEDYGGKLYIHILIQKYTCADSIVCDSVAKSLMNLFFYPLELDYLRENGGLHMNKYGPFIVIKDGLEVYAIDARCEDWYERDWNRFTYYLLKDAPIKDNQEVFIGYCGDRIDILTEDYFKDFRNEKIIDLESAIELKKSHN